MIPANIEILKPCYPLDRPHMEVRAQQLSAALEKELSPGHVLYRVAANAVATRIDRDDVLFEIEDDENCLAVVHLTWQRETDPSWPTVKLFRSWDQWASEEMMPAHQAYALE